MMPKPAPIANGNPRTPTIANRKKNKIPKMIAEMALMPSQSATRRSPGFPASARRFSVFSVKDVDATRDIRPDRPAASGRSVRSMNGACSSSSSRFLACMVPSWVRRAWTGSTGALPPSPRTIRRIAPAARAATAMGRISIRLDLDVHDLADHHEADEHHESAEDQDHNAGRESQDGRWVEEHGLHEVGCGDEQEAGERDRQEADDVAGQPLLRRQGSD